MKQIYFFAVMLFFGFNSFAECNLKLASVAGQYLAELEKARLQKYQNNSVCEVLDYELANCSDSQKEKLKKDFDYIEVWGNYCQPHLPPPKNALSKDYFIKGADLFSWQDQSGYYWYSVLPGTNRLKKMKEIVENKISEGALKEMFKQIPEDTDIHWNSMYQMNDKKKNIEFSLPPKKALDGIKTKASQAKLKLQISK